MSTPRAWAFALTLFTSSAIACTPSPVQKTVSERVKELYEYYAVVAHVRLGPTLSAPLEHPTRAAVLVVESFKGSAPQSVSRDMTTCGFDLKKEEGREFVIFIERDGYPIGVGNVIWQEEVAAALPVLRELRAKR